MFITLRHSNNIGTVGWTSIWALMNYEEMTLLRTIAPKGDFVPTFNQPSKGGLFKFNDPETHRQFIGDGETDRAGYYYQFPMDKEGEQLIAMLMTICNLELDDKFVREYPNWRRVI